jgi:hypothetical protein
MTFQGLVTEINNAFFRLESFMKGTITDYHYFGFNKAVNKLFIEARKPENYTYDNCKLIGEYWKLAQQIGINYDQSEYENWEFIYAEENEDVFNGFHQDCYELIYLYDDQIEKFIEFSTSDEIAESERKFSITDILKVPALPTQQSETKTDKLKAELGKYGFFELPKVKQLSEPNRQKLIELISRHGLPYSIAMFEFLDFLKHIAQEHFKTKDKLNKEVAKWFNSDKDGRAVKGNISSLSDYSNENKSKYTAHTHKKTVKTDYQKLK